MINLRIYRAGLLLVPIAIVIAMFSLQSEPSGLPSSGSSVEFNGGVAATLAKRLATMSPDPTPGSQADQALAKQVIQSFGQIPGAQVSEQSFGHLQNVICVLPGQSEQQVVLIAARDALRGTGAASADASTAALIELASGLGASTHTKTLVFVSTDGSTEGATGVKRFADGFSGISSVEAAVVLSQPAAPNPSQPFVIPWSSGPQSTAIQLVQTASKAITDETKLVPAKAGGFSELSRLAIPDGLGEQAPLIERGINAVRISSSGERPPKPSEAGPEKISPQTLGLFGRATQAMILALDSSSAALDHGPGAYVHVAGNLVPGWALSVVALSLILPLVLVAIDATVRQAQKPGRILPALLWVIGQALPFIGALGLAYFLALVGALPTPAFPYDPGGIGVGVRAAINLSLIGAALVAGLYFARPWRRPPDPAAPAAPALCVALICLAAFGVWLSNPYLALLIVPAMHAWLLLTAEETAVGSLLAGVLTIIGLLPLLAAIAALADRFGVGIGVVWQLFVLLGDGQIGFWTAVLGCLLAGCGLSALALARARIVRPPPEIEIKAAQNLA